MRTTKPNSRNASPARLKEKDITRTVRDYLQLRGWRPVRINAGPFGKAGMPDFLMLRYGAHLQAFWLEVKSSTGRLSQVQALWIDEERRRGATVIVCGDVDRFIEWYEASYGHEGQLRLGG